MDGRQRALIELIVGHEADLYRRSFSERMSAVYTDHAARGRLRSGATIRVIVREMGESAGQLVDSLVEKVGEICRDADAFQLLSGAVNSALEFLGEQMPGITKMASGQTKAGGPDEGIRQAAMKLFDQMRADIGTKLAIREFEFDAIIVRESTMDRDEFMRLYGGGIKFVAADYDELECEQATAKQKPISQRNPCPNQFFWGGGTL